MTDVRPIETLAPAASRGEDLTGAIILATDPLFETTVCGLTVLERMVSALRKSSVAKILILAPRSTEPLVRQDSPSRVLTEVDWLEPGTRGIKQANGWLRAAGGRFLLFTSPVVIDANAVEFLATLVGNADSCVRLCGPAGPGGNETAGFLVGGPRSIVDLLPHEMRPGVEALPRIRVRKGVFRPLKKPDDWRLAQSALLESLGKSTDGFLAKWIDRRLSCRLTGLLVRTPVTPNQLTVLSLLPGLAGAVCLAFPDPLWSAGGAVSFWFSTVLDGCDGEVARLKHQESAQGARLDILCDNFVLLAVFVGIVVHVYGESRQTTVLLLAAAIVIGMLGCMISEYLLLLRPRIRSNSLRAAVTRPPDSARVRWYERLASRDFAYALPFVAYFGWLRYLVWGAAIGVNVFWLVFVAFVARPGRPKSVTATESR